jgi:hypothetical protein
VQIPTSLIGSQVYQIKFDYQTTLELFHQEDNGTIRVHADLVIFSPFVLRSSDATIYNLAPATSRAALAPVIDLFQGTITSVTVDGNAPVERDGNGNPLNALGTLTIDFTDGAQLTVPPVPIPDDSWELSYPYDQPNRRIRPRLRRIRLRWPIQASRARQRGLGTAELSRS